MAAQDSVNHGYCMELSRWVWRAASELRSHDADADAEAEAEAEAEAKVEVEAEPAAIDSRLPIPCEVTPGAG